MKKPAQIHKFGGFELLQLYDIGTADGVCDFLEDVGNPFIGETREDREQRIGALTWVNGLIKKAEGWHSQNPAQSREQRAEAQAEQRAEAQALFRFMSAVEDAIDRLSAFDPMDTQEANALADGVRRAWIEFIARACSPLMYTDAMREIDVQKNRTWNMQDKRDALAYAARTDHDRIIERYAELAATKARGIRKLVAAEFGLSEHTVKNIWNSRPK